MLVFLRYNFYGSTNNSCSFQAIKRFQTNLVLFTPFSKDNHYVLISCSRIKTVKTTLCIYQSRYEVAQSDNGLIERLGCSSNISSLVTDLRVLHSVGSGTNHYLFCYRNQHSKLLECIRFSFIYIGIFPEKNCFPLCLLS